MPTVTRAISEKGCRSALKAIDPVATARQRLLEYTEIHPSLWGFSHYSGDSVVRVSAESALTVALNTPLD